MTDEIAVSFLKLAGRMGCFSHTVSVFGILFEKLVDVSIQTWQWLCWKWSILTSKTTKNPATLGHKRCRCVWCSLCLNIEENHPYIAHGHGRCYWYLISRHDSSCRTMEYNNSFLNQAIGQDWCWYVDEFSYVIRSLREPLHTPLM